MLFGFIGNCIFNPRFVKCCAIQSLLRVIHLVLEEIPLGPFPGGTTEVLEKIQISRTANRGAPDSLRLLFVRFASSLTQHLFFFPMTPVKDITRL